MACNIDEIINDSLDEVRSIIQGKAKSIKVNTNHAKFDYGPDYKVKKLSQAVKTAQGKQAAIEKWAEAKFGKAFSKGWTELKTSPSSVYLDFSFPGNLKKAYALKQARESQEQEFQDRAREANESIVDGEVMPFEDSFDEMVNTSQSLDNINFGDYVNQKENLVKMMDKKLSDLFAKIRTSGRTQELVDETDRVTSLKKRLEEEIIELKNSVNPLEDTFGLFESDMQLINYLLDHDDLPIENLYEAEAIYRYLAVSTVVSRDNKENLLFGKDRSAITSDILDELGRINGKLIDIRHKLVEAKQEYLLKIIDDSPKLKALFPSDEAVEIREQLEDIREMLLEAREDINIGETMFMPLGKQVVTEDSLLSQLVRIEVDNKRSAAKIEASGIIEKLTRQTPNIVKKLRGMGQSVSNKAFDYLNFSEVSYDMFKQRDEFGNLTSKLISKYSQKWDKVKQTNKERTSASLKRAFSEKDSDKRRELIRKAYQEKFNWHKKNTNFFDIRKVPEIINDPSFRGWTKRFQETKSEAYKQALIASIGEAEYNKLVTEQKEKLEFFRAEMRNLVNSLLAEEGVSTFDELSHESKFKIKYTNATTDPFLILDSEDGAVDVENGNTSHQFVTHTKYNTNFPKKEIGGNDSGFYDKKFDQIAADPELLEYWQTLTEAAEFINLNIADGSTKVHANSIANLKRNALDLIFDSRIKGTEKVSIFFENTKAWLKDTFSTPDDVLDRGEEVRKGPLANTIENEVSRRVKTAKLALARLKGTTSDVKSLDLGTETDDVIQYLADLVGAEDRMELIQKVGINISDVDYVLTSFINNQVMTEQTLNLPVVMKAFVDMTAEYKARKDAHPRVRVMADLYHDIQLKKSGKQSDLDRSNALTRTRDIAYARFGFKTTENRIGASTRMNDFVDRNVLGKNRKEKWARFGKNYTKEEKELKAELEWRREKMKETQNTFKAAGNFDAVIELEQRIADIDIEIKNLGQTYTLAASYNASINRFAIFKGLAWNLKAAIINRQQGWFQGAVNDTGKYWKKGNFTTANGFIMRKSLAKLNPKGQYATEIKKTKMLINRLEILQDATNEIDRARNESGNTGLFKKGSPFYLTEYIEWHNQVPQVLSMLMDQQITDENGNSVPIFDGFKFPAHDINDKGELVLKEQFATPENKETWQDFKSVEFRDIKSKMDATISVMNGDYSKTGTTYAKSFVLGKTLMLFKTWLGSQVWQRFANKQTDIQLGIRDYDGFYTGSFKSDKTKVMARTATAIGVSAAAFSSLPIVLAGGMVGVMGYKMYKNYRENKQLKLQHDLQVDGNVLAEMASTVGKMLRTGASIPFNTISAATGSKMRIKEVTFADLDLTDQERQNIDALMREMTMIVGGVLMKITMAALLTGDEEDEPKTIDGIPNPNYESEEAREERKRWNNLLENMSTAMLDNIILYINARGMLNTISVDGVERLVENLWQFGTALMTLDREKGAKSLEKIFVPSVFRGNFGFGPYMEREYENDELVDQIFRTDYKADRMESRKTRKKFKDEYKELLRKKYDYYNQTEEEQIYIDEAIDEEIKYELEDKHAIPHRGQYDDDQNRKDN